MNKILFLAVFISIFFVPFTASALIADHEAVAEFEDIPSQWFDLARSKYGYIFYGHTSHGSQITTGIDMLASEKSLYKSPSFKHYNDDLGHKGDVSWVQPTKNFLDNPANSGYKVVMWSWCGGVSDNTEAGINAYLSAMSQLERDYPNITFIYMTGHLDGTGEAGNLRIRNQQIRNYAVKNNKILFDFEDIESWNPDGKYYPNETDACKWCSAWCSSHACSPCGKCAHSHCFNCYLKGKAFWWMMAKLAGWGGETEVPQSEPEPDPEPQPEPKPEPKPEPSPDPRPEPEPSPEPKPEPELEPEIKPELEPEIQPEPEEESILADVEDQEPPKETDLMSKVENAFKEIYGYFKSFYRYFISLFDFIK